MKTHSNNGSGRWARRRGFTLIEIMIAVTLIGILALMTVPGIVKRIPKYRVDSAGDRLYGDLLGARMRAMSEGNYVYFKFLSGSKQYDIWTTSDKAGTQNVTAPKSTSFNDLKGVNVSCWPETGAFGPTGEFSSNLSTPSTLWIWIWGEPTAGSQTIAIWPSGQVYVYKWLGG